MSAAPILAALEGLEKARQVNGKFMACCPAHKDRNPSLSWTEADDGSVLIHCFAGCTPEEVVAALGMTMRDLFNGQSGPARYEPMTPDRQGHWGFQSDRDADDARDRKARILSWSDLMAEPNDPPPVHRPGIPKVGVVVLAGSPKAGKSLWVSQTIMETRRPALLVIEEGARPSIAYRLRRQAAELGIDTPPIEVMYRQRVRLDDPASVAQLRAYVLETRPEIVALDPLNRLHSADENRPSAMTPVMDALADMAYDEGGRTIIAVHHVNKPSMDRRGDIWDRLRGASSIRSGTDANLVLDGRGDRIHLVGEFRDADPLSEWMELDHDTLTFRSADAPQAPAKVDPILLREYVEERQQVVVKQVVEQFGVSRNTAIGALRALGCDEYPGPRGTLTFTLGTGQ